jgi:Tetratricopeptide repeat/WW domain
LQPLYQADYRVRRAIRYHVDKRVIESSKPYSEIEKQVFQLAFCYKTGFGGLKDEFRARQLLDAINKKPQVLMERLDNVCLWIEQSADENALSEIQYDDHTQYHGKHSEAAEVMSQELADIESLLGSHSQLWHFHARKLLRNYRLAGSTGSSNSTSNVESADAKAMPVQQITQLENKILETTRQDEVKALANSVTAKLNQRGWNDAIELGFQKLMALEDIFLSTDIATQQERDSDPLLSNFPNDIEWRKHESRMLGLISKIQSNSDCDQLGALPHLRHLARLYKSRNEWGKAEIMETRIMKTIKTVGAMDYPSIEVDMINLANTYQRLEEWQEALEVLRELRTRFQEALGDDHEVTLICASILALLYRIRGRLHEADELEAIITMIREATLGIEDLKLTVWDNYARKPKTSTNFLENELLASRRPANLGMDEWQPDFAYVIVQNDVFPENWQRGCNREGESCWINRDTGKSTIQPPVLHDALYIVPAGWQAKKTSDGQTLWTNERLGIAGPDRPQYLPRGWQNRVDDKGQEYWHDPILKESTYQRPLNLPAGWRQHEDERNRTYFFNYSTGTRHWSRPRYADVLNLLDMPALNFDVHKPHFDKEGRLYWIIKGPHHDGEQKALEERENPECFSWDINQVILERNEGRSEWRRFAEEQEALGCRYTSSLGIVVYLGDKYYAQGRVQNAEEAYELALKGFDGRLHSEHITVLEVARRMIDCCIRLGRVDELDEEEDWGDLASAYEKALGSEHVLTLQVMARLGRCYHLRKRLQEAEAMYQQAAAGREKVFGPEHGVTLGTMFNLATIYRAQRRLDDAEKLIQRVLIGCEKGNELLGLRRKCYKVLGYIYRKRDMQKEADAMYAQATEDHK